MHGGLHKRLRGGCESLHTAQNRGAPPFANTMLAWLVSKKTHMLSSNLAQAGGCWGAATPVCKHTARIVNGGGGGERRLSSKLAHSLRALGQPPPLQTPCSHGWFQKKLICCQASLHKRGVRGRSSPPIFKHSARMVNGGVSQDSIQLKTALSHYHRPHRRHCHLHVHVHLHRHHQQVYVSRHECMYVYAMDVI